MPHISRDPIYKLHNFHCSSSTLGKVQTHGPPQDYVNLNAEGLERRGGGTRKRVEDSTQGTAHHSSHFERHILPERGSGAGQNGMEDALGGHAAWYLVGRGNDSFISPGI